MKDSNNELYSQMINSCWSHQVFFMRSYDIIQFKTQNVSMSVISLKTFRMNDTENICWEEFYWCLKVHKYLVHFFLKEKITDFCTHMLSCNCLFRMNNLHAPLEKIEIIPSILEQFELEPLLFIQNNLHDMMFI